MAAKTNCKGQVNSISALLSFYHFIFFCPIQFVLAAGLLILSMKYQFFFLFLSFCCQQHLGYKLMDLTYLVKFILWAFSPNETGQGIESGNYNETRER